MKKIFTGLVISTMILSSMNISYGDNIDLNSLLNELDSANSPTGTTSYPSSTGTTNSSNSTGTTNSSNSTGTTNNSSSTVIKPITTTSPITQDTKQDIMVDSNNSFKQTIKNNYLLKFKVDKDWSVENIFSVKYVGDFGDNITISGKDIVKEFDVKVVRDGKSELSLAKGTLKDVKSGDELLITPTSTSLILNKELTFTVSSNITPVEYWVVNAETNSYVKLGNYIKNNSQLTNIETETPVENETWPMTNILVIIGILLGMLFYMRKNKIIV